METVLNEIIDKWESEKGSYIPHAPLYNLFINEMKMYLLKEQLQLKESYLSGVLNDNNFTKDELKKQIKTLNQEIYNKSPETCLDSWEVNEINYCHKQKYDSCKKCYKKKII
jgi:hypothetical protein